MFNNAHSLPQFKFCRRCILGYVNKMSRRVDENIGDLYYYMQELFVKKVLPNLDVDTAHLPENWVIEIDNMSEENIQCMIQVRKLIMECYSDM